MSTLESVELPDRDDLSLHRTSDGLVATIFVTGEIDLATTPALFGSAQRALSYRPDRVLIDLQGVTFFGATGVHALNEICDAAEAAGAKPLLSRPSRALMAVLRICGQSEAFETSPDGNKDTGSIDHF
jgi:anti-sigma B factor antagonist